MGCPKDVLRCGVFRKLTQHKDHENLDNNLVATQNSINCADDAIYSLAGCCWTFYNIKFSFCRNVVFMKVVSSL